MNSKIILFDGVCNFCNFWVNFIIDRDKKDHFKFAALQSSFGQEFLERNNFNSKSFDTFILIEDEKFYIKSTAALRIAKHLKGWPQFVYPFIFLPAFIRDFFYNIIAKNRYKFFGKKNSCRIPTSEEKAKFVE